ncbi:Protein kish-A [Fusarium oxysporum f. sp. albedinis]|nr:Protein kish-A [Fusarium oxysporum f. sp. albedinis]
MQFLSHTRQTRPQHRSEPPIPSEHLREGNSACLQGPEPTTSAVEQVNTDSDEGVEDCPGKSLHLFPHGLVEETWFADASNQAMPASMPSCGESRGT